MQKGLVSFTQSPRDQRRETCPFRKRALRFPPLRFMPRRFSNTDHVAYRQMQNVACDKLEVGWRERKYKSVSRSREDGSLPLMVFEWQRGAGEGQIRAYLLSGF